MPGFIFYFNCNACETVSDEYSIFPFHDIIRPSLQLPTWSTVHGCWGHIRFSLDSAKRNEIKTDPEALVAFAESVSSPSLTVCVPRLTYDEIPGVYVTPNPVCPKCQLPCDALFGYRPREEKLKIAEISVEDVDSLSLNSIEISVRTRNLCSMLGIRTIGQLRKEQDSVARHSRATESTVSEIDRWLKLGQG